MEERDDTICINLMDEDVYLHSERAISWSNALFLADLHLGKIAHFRKSGLPVPDRAADGNLERLIDLIRKTEPEKVFFLGDLFHSHYNSEWEPFREILHYFEEIEFCLVEGNHDILSQYRYRSARLRVSESERIGPFILTHIPMEADEIPRDKFNISGHIHPGARLTGKGRQSITLPCFHFSQRYGILPAFGIFTGHHKVTKRKDDRIFVIAGKRLIEK